MNETPKRSYCHRGVWQLTGLGSCLFLPHLAKPFSVQRILGKVAPPGLWCSGMGAGPIPGTRPPRPPLMKGLRPGEG